LCYITSGVRKELLLVVVGAAVGFGAVGMVPGGLIGSNPSPEIVRAALKSINVTADVKKLKQLDLTIPDLKSLEAEPFEDWMRELVWMEENREVACKAALGIVKEGLLTVAEKKGSPFDFSDAAKTASYVFLEAGELSYPEAISKDYLRHSGYRFPTGVDGDSLHAGHQFAGLVAVRRGDLKGAGEHLIRSLDSFSPVTGSFGPRMRLADELLQKGEFEAVRRYFLRCKEGWSFAKESGIDSWISAVEQKKMPSGDRWEQQLGYL